MGKLQKKGVTAMHTFNAASIEKVPKCSYDPLKYVKFFQIEIQNLLELSTAFSVGKTGIRT